MHDGIHIEIQSYLREFHHDFSGVLFVQRRQGAVHASVRYVDELAGFSGRGPGDVPLAFGSERVLDAQSAQVEEYLEIVGTK